MSETPWQKAEEKWKKEKKRSLFSKLILLGIPVFLFQVVVIYFLTAKFIVPITGGGQRASAHESHLATHEDAREGIQVQKDDFITAESDESETGEQHIYVVKDLIINPAHTNGTRFLLTTIGFKMSNMESVSEMGKKEIQVRDILNTILTSKTLDQLVSVSLRDSLRAEIGNEVKKVVQGGKLQNVFFGKFIIQ